MNDQQYFLTTSLSYQLKAARRELADFRSGEICRKPRADYEGVIRELNLTIKKLRRERDAFSLSRKEIKKQWTDVLEDVQKEHEKETGKLKKAIAELLDITASLKNRNKELDEKRKKALSDHYATAVKLEEALGLILKLTAQVDHDHENSSMPSSKCIGRKKITNNREKTGKKPGARAGHPHHPRRPMEPDRALVMHVDGTVARVNGNNNSVVVCSNGAATMYLARENKGHAGIKGTPVGSFGGILIHDHEACFYGHGSDHQECMVHIERYLKDIIENEKDLTWNRQMLTLIQEMIHENNAAPAEGVAEEKIADFEARYDPIVQTAGEEYEATPASDYYRDGYDLYLRMVKYKHDHLLFLSNPLVGPDNNLCERKARILKGKINQAISLRSFEHLVHFCECLSVLDHLPPHFYYLSS